MPNHPVRLLLARLLDQDPVSLNAEKTWSEMGMDSLLLTQWSLKLQKEFDIPVSLKRLQGDLPSLKRLTEAFPALMPHPSFVEDTPVATEQSPEIDGSAGDFETQSISGRDLHQVLQNQIHLMNRQLDLLQAVLGNRPDLKPFTHEPGGGSSLARPPAAPPKRPLETKTFYTDRGTQTMDLPEGAFLGLDESGQPAPFLEDPERPGAYLKIEGS